MNFTIRAAAAVAVGVVLASAPHAAPVPAARPYQPRPARSFETHQSLDRLRRLTLAIHSYHDLHDHMPQDIRDKDGKPLLSWRVAILPYLDLDFLHAQFKLDEPWDGPHNKKLAAFMPDVFRAPIQDRTASETYYQAVSGPGAIFDPAAKVTLQGVTDGTSGTLMLVEAGPPVPWSKPADVAFDPDRDPPELAGPFTDALHVAVADGSRLRMKPKPDPERLRAFITRAGGEVFEPKHLRVAPVMPVTEAEKKEFADRKERARQSLREAAGFAEDRFRVEEALRKLGPLPQLDLGPAGSEEELDELMEHVNERQWADRFEFYRLIEVLEEKNPKLAEAIKKAHARRLDGK